MWQFHRAFMVLAWVTCPVHSRGSPIGFFTSEDCDDPRVETLSSLAENGRLSEARILALAIVSDHRPCQHVVVGAYDVGSHKYFEHGFLESSTSAQSSPSLAKHDDVGCWVDQNQLETFSAKWDFCCSILPPWQLTITKTTEKNAQECFGANATRMCCELFPSSPAHLRLPALQEPRLRLRLPFTKESPFTVEVEQEGFLRPFDESGILWPGGCLLAMCLANPKDCGIPEIDAIFGSYLHKNKPVAVELGSGIGLGTLALGLYARTRYSNASADAFPLVVTTDHVLPSLSLALDNCNRYSLPALVEKIDHLDVSSLVDMRRKYLDSDDGFQVVFGSSLKELFRGTRDASRCKLWRVLDALLEHRQGYNLAVFVHTRWDPLYPPDDGSFELVRKVSGDRYQMRTAAGDSSDFEVSVFRRSSHTREQNEL